MIFHIIDVISANILEESEKFEIANAVAVLMAIVAGGIILCMILRQEGKNFLISD